MKFCFKLGKTAIEMHEMLVRVYSDAAECRKTVYKWFERYLGGAESTDDEQRSGLASTSTTEENLENNEMVRADKTLMIREISNALNMSFGAVQLLLTNNLNMRQVSAKFVPCL
jgi:hypothetical protein